MHRHSYRRHRVVAQRHRAGSTGQTYLTFWPTGALQPNASSLNPAPGQPPTPNAVITDISTGGQFNIFNESGTVGAIIDINGYYVGHNHDDRYYTEAEVDARVNAAKSITVYAGGDQRLPLTQTQALYRTVTIVPPVNGTVIVNAAGAALGLAGATFTARCSITTQLSRDAGSSMWANETAWGFAGTRGFTVSAGVPLSVNLICDRFSAGIEVFIEDTWMTATFTPT